jgi:lysophospholipase L1-like esterase
MKRIAATYFVVNILAGSAFAQSHQATYLALGDSIPFGMNVTLLAPYTSNIPTPAEFVGYPDVVSAVDKTAEVNAGCPGETSGSFLDTTVMDNGCNSPHIVPPAVAGLPLVTILPFKTTYGLHTAYTGSQMAFATSQFQTNKNIKLVTLNIGANDVLLVLPQLLPQLEQCTYETCVQTVLAPVLKMYKANLIQILTEIRAQYKGTLILMTYYSPQIALNLVTQALNSTMTQVAKGFPSIGIADAYTAFQVASIFSGGDACQAGLLIKLPPSPYDLSPCDIHPSPLGRDILAATLELSLLTQH